MSAVQDLDREFAGDERVGGKARNLARLHAAKLPCPRGFVIPHAALTTDRWREIANQKCTELSAPFAVRSSASIEDRVGGAAPGLFESILGVDAEGLEEAVGAVVDSASSASVRSYCLLRNLDPTSVTMSVVVMEQVTDVRASGVLYTRPPSRPEAPSLVVDIEYSDNGPWSGERARDGSGSPVPLPNESWAKLIEVALAAESAIGAPRGADVEWVLDRKGRLWLVQARPIVHTSETRAAEPSLFAFSEGDEREWTWDVTHNPDPLSPAQAGLVELVGQTGVGGEMRVVGGYLYTAPTSKQAAPAYVDDSPGALTRFFTDEIVPAVDAELAPLERGAPPELERALSAYRTVVALYSQTVAPTLRSGREPLRRFLDGNPWAARLGTQMTALLATRSDRHLAARIRRVAAEQEDIASLLAYAAPMAPAWDVAAPTFAEEPGPILAAVAASRQRSGPSRPDDTREAGAQAIRLRASLDRDNQHIFDRALTRAREAHELGETDDHVFFRAQAVVRRALLGVAAGWDLEDPSDVFYLNLDWVLAQASRPDLGELKTQVLSARTRREQQRATHMPLSFQQGGPRPARSRGAGLGFRGVGCGGRARGQVLKIRDLGTMTSPAQGRVVIARSLSPSLLFQVAGAAALVSVYGGPLGHGAAMARELGLACVVQCHGAWEALVDGDDVWVDGETGLVVPAPDS